MGQDAPRTEQALAADLGAGEELPVIGVEVGIDLVHGLGGVDFAGAGPVVLVQVGVEVHAAIPDRVVELAEFLEGLPGDRQGEARDHRHVQQGRCRVAGVGGMPLLDLLRVSRMASSSLVIKAAAESGPTVWMPRPLTIRSPRRLVSVNRASWACGKADPKTTAAVVPAAIRRSQKSAARRRGEIRVGETGFGREDAGVQPLQQLAAAVGVAAVRLREMHVGVDEAGEQESWPVIHRRRAAQLGRQVAERAAEDDSSAVVDRQRAVGQRDQRLRARRSPSVCR